jgi:S1-C subfamily serine protease
MKVFTLPILTSFLLTLVPPYSKSLAQNTKPEDIVVKVLADIEYADASEPIFLETKPIQTKVAGSGVLYGNYVVTNSHVIEGFKTVVFQKNNGEIIPASFVGSSYCDDVAIFRIQNPKNFGNYAFKANFQKNEKLVSFGYNSRKKSIQSVVGKIASINTKFIDSKQIDHSLILLDTDIALGFSGGGVFDAQNTLVGINQSVNFEYKKSFLIPFYMVKEIIANLESKRYIYTAGLSGSATYSPYLKKYGIIVTAITPKSKKSEVKIGDIITEINGNELQALSPYNTFCSAIPKDATTLQVKGYHIKNQKEFNIQLNK